MNDYVVLAAGFACAAIGAELFVRGAVGLAFLLRIGPGIVGATVAAFATSSPELSVAVSAAMAGVPQIAFGDVLGANIVNVSLVLSSALLISALRCSRASIRRDFPVALLTPALTGALAVDSEISRGDGVLLLAVFLIWMFLTVQEACRQRSGTEPDPSRGEWHGWRLIAALTAGLLILFAAGDLIVSSAKGIARGFGVGEFVIGAVLVAVGTTVPELATTFVSKLRGYDDVGLGTVLGSIIYNACFIVAVAAIIHPIGVDQSEAFVALGFGLAAMLCAYPGRDGVIGRGRAIWLLLLYASYLTILLQV